MQTWVALPKSHEEIEPAFYHHAAATLPEQRRNGAWLRVIAGRAYGEESPVKVFADTSTWQSISTRMRKSISTTATASARCTSSKATRSWMAWISLRSTW
jgi:redox-sensitive bicupin YhaK (pirin superfamily)